MMITAVSAYVNVSYFTFYVSGVYIHKNLF